MVSTISRQTDVLQVTDATWSRTYLRQKVLAPLALLDAVSHGLADEAATTLGVSRRTVYKLLAQMRQGDGLVTDLLPKQRGVAVGTGRLAARVEEIISRHIETRYLTRQRRTVSALLEGIARECRRERLLIPSRSSVQRRIDLLDPAIVERRRRGTDAARRYSPITAPAPMPEGPLQVVQMDHTPLDVIVVDEAQRLDIGRGYLTLAIDLYSRCIVGLFATFDAPSATSVGLCLTQVVSDKSHRIESFKDIIEWPMAGKPRVLHVDNGADFHSRALERGCEQHGIELRFGRPGSPQDRAHVERVIGTINKMVHDLPGTTFSSVNERGTYNSSNKAIMTLRELDEWLVLTVAKYHGTIHSELRCSPAAMWAKGVASIGQPAVVTDTSGFLLDFLPVEERSVRREGFVWDYIHYHSSALNPWISRREKMAKFTLRRDPRDISRIWVFDPVSKALLEVPATRMLKPRTIWEHRAAIAELRRQGSLTIDEEALDRIAAELERVESEATATTKAIRRKTEIAALRPARPTLVLPDPPELNESVSTVAPFKVARW